MASRTTRTPEERSAEMREIHDALERQVSELATSEQWADMLATAARFHAYSFGNIMWLQMQAASRGMSLSRVAGYRAWQALDRQVIKGETSLRVLAPMRCKVADSTTGEDKWIVRGFTTAPVFDISQTEGEPIADVRPELLTVGGEPAVLAAVVAMVEAAGFTYAQVPPAELGGANGICDHAAKTVRVRSDVELAQKLKTTVHEYAHALLHSPSECEYRTERARCEVEAESVAYVVLTALGVPAEDYSLPYVAGWSGGNTSVVRATAEAVIRCAHMIVTALDGIGAAQLEDVTA